MKRSIFPSSWFSRSEFTRAVNRDECWPVSLLSSKAAIASMLTSGVDTSEETAEQIAGAARAIADRISQGDKVAMRSLVIAARLDPGQISVTLNGPWFASNLEVAMEDLASDVLSISAPFRLRRRGVETRIIAGTCAPALDPTLIRLLAQAHQWIIDLRNGKSLCEIAQRDGHSGSYVRTRAQLAFLSPRIQAAILDGTQPAELSAARILRTGIPLDWAEQERIFGFKG